MKRFTIIKFKKIDKIFYSPNNPSLSSESFFIDFSLISFLFFFSFPSLTFFFEFFFSQLFFSLFFWAKFYVPSSSEWESPLFSSKILNLDKNNEISYKFMNLILLFFRAVKINVFWKVSYFFAFLKHNNIGLFCFFLLIYF